MADEPYIVLARKHRPRQLDEVIGQEHIARTLKNAIDQNRLAHALLFTGPRGIGKTSMARILSRALNCQHGPTPTPCYQCPSCLEISQGSSVDVIEIDAASNRGIDEIRELREAVRYPPSRERYKVYIIDEVHMLTPPAFNALLKTLEEPPPQVVFIFATTEPHKIPETIRSRCQRHDFRRIPIHLIEQHLAKIAGLEQISIDSQALRIIAQQSEGCMRDAQSLMDQLISFSGGQIDGELATQVLGVLGRDALFTLSRALLERNVDTVLEVVNGAYRVGVNLVQMASDLLEHLRDLTVCAVSADPLRLAHLSDLEQQQLHALAALTDPTTLHRMFTILLAAVEDMSRSAYPKLVLEMALLRMTAIEPLQPVGAVIQRIEQILAGNPLAALSSASPPAANEQLPRIEQPKPTGQNQRSRPAPTSLSGPASISAPARTTIPTSGTAPPPDAALPSDSAPSDSAPTAGSSSQAGPMAPPLTTARPVHERCDSARPTPALPDDDSAEQSHGRRWRQLVDAVSERSRTVGGLLKVAEVVAVEGCSFTVQLPGATFDIIQDPLKLRLINEVAAELFGSDACVTTILRSNEAPAPQTPHYSVDREERQEVETELKRRAQVILEHPATALLDETFHPTEVRIKPRPVDEQPVLEPES
ncbi:MAG: DNA polymerase III subunit gamma/tau [Bradymonadales bacterium]|nr:DNA polymerase III subunit gamma/tau [Bradymonadales bacterium]